MDNNEILQITGTIEDIIYRNNDNGYSVVDVDVKKELITATGVMPTVEVGMEGYTVDIKATQAMVYSFV